MYYCEPCRAERNWPQTVATSYGPCEMCRKHTECYDVPISQLNEPRSEPPHPTHAQLMGVRSERSTPRPRTLTLPPHRTRGVWQMDHDIVQGVFIHNDEVVIAYCYAEEMPIEEARANGQLIAAAPELLTALGQLLDERKQGYHTGSTGFDLASGAYHRATESDR